METKRLVKNYNKVVVEDLNLQGMSKFLCNAKNLVDTSWGTFVSKLELKGKKYGCKVIKADRYFPSSQLCSNCGFQYKSLKLSERKWICPCCKTKHIRDHNAAINLKNYILVQHQEFTSTNSENNFETCESVLALALQVLEAEDEVEMESGNAPENTPKSL